MKVLYEIDDLEEIERFSRFFHERNIVKASVDAETRKAILTKMFETVKIILPPDYKFDRNEIYDRARIS